MKKKGAPTPSAIHMDARGTLRADDAAVRAVIRKMEQDPSTLTGIERRYVIQAVIEHGLPKDQVRKIKWARRHLLMEQAVSIARTLHERLDALSNTKRDGRRRYSEQAFRDIAMAYGFQSADALRQWRKRERQWLSRKKQP